ncbi:MAG: hypothetical protein K2X93_26215 [Candidatus Obscuribacterales bacterium]|nr:hypothetical protein [Candidatus Obscuribacterales bacterium]
MERALGLSPQQCNACFAPLIAIGEVIVQSDETLMLAEQFFDQMHFPDLRPLKPPYPIPLDVPHLKPVELAVLECLCDGVRGNENIAARVTQKTKRTPPYSSSYIKDVTSQLIKVFGAKNAKHVVSLAQKIGLNNFHANEE